MQSGASCPACGSPGSGRFCARCGSPLTTTLRGRRVWRIAAGAGALLLVVLTLTVLRERDIATSVTASSTAEPRAESPPDLSAMSPRERFDRLYNRVMRAAESGDTATLAQFAPMAFAAYRMLDTIDADARYHVAVLDLHVRGDTAAALRQADSILSTTPRHLFGYLIRATAARLVGNEPLRQRAKSDFLAAWESEQKAGRPEYRDHQAMLEQFRTRP